MAIAAMGPAFVSIFCIFIILQQLEDDETSNPIVGRLLEMSGAVSALACGPSCLVTAHANQESDSMTVYDVEHHDCLARLQ